MFLVLWNSDIVSGFASIGWAPKWQDRAKENILASKLALQITQPPNQNNKTYSIGLVDLPSLGICQRRCLLRLYQFLHQGCQVTLVWKVWLFLHCFWGGSVGEVCLVWVRLRWLFRGFLATGYIARYIWLYSQPAIQPDISGYIANIYIARDNWLHISNLNSWSGYLAMP